jgi:hypothetical protein
MKRDDYKEVGEKVIEGDREIERKEIRKRDQVLNSHSAMWCSPTWEKHMATRTGSGRASRQGLRTKPTCTCWQKTIRLS